MDTLHKPATCLTSKDKSAKYPRSFGVALLCCFVTLAGISPSLANAEAVAGFVAGDISVGPDGSANYSVPIGVPPGVAGMQPELSINYNSNGGNGLLGIGFSIGGQSAITRCPATLSQDGFKGGIYFDDSGRDRYCMDGQRLIAISGNDGAAEVEYKTEIDSFSRIISHGQKGYGPDYWEVITKSGQILEYGNSDDSKVERTGYVDVRTWAVSSISDVVGNSITFSYHEDDVSGEHYLLRIDYSVNSIQFEYEPRPDPTYGYQGGGKLSMTKRLANIAVFGDGTKVQDYSLNYLQSKKSLLESISKTDANGNAMPELTFDWDKGSVDHVQTFSNNYTTLLPDTYAKQIQNHSKELVKNYIQCTDYTYRDWDEDYGIVCALRDMNGDGLLDRIVNESFTNPDIGRKQGMQVALNTGSGFGAYTTWHAGGGVFGNVQYKDTSGVYFDLLDMDGDGKPDRVVHEYGGTTGIHVALNNGHGFGSYSLWLRGGSGQDGRSHLRGMTGDGDYYSDLLDMNGDGRPDHIIHYNYVTQTAGLHVAINNGHGFDGYKLWLRGGSGQHPSNYFHTKYSDLRDMNGDGLPDHVSNKDYKNDLPGMYVALNNGAGFDSYTCWHPPGNGQPNNDIWSASGDAINSDLIDMNGDGLPDRVKGDGAGIHVALNTGKGFASYELWLSSGSGQYGNSTRRSNSSGVFSDLRDINGDGLPDQLTYKNDSTKAPGIHVAVNNGHGFEPYVLLLPHDASSTTYDFIQRKVPHSMDEDRGEGVYADFLDWNGDGLLDRVEGLSVILNTTTRPEVVGIVTQSNNAISIAYKPLSDNSVYTKGTGPGYPEMDIGGPMRVVSKVTNPDGVGGTLSTSYKYKHFKVDLRGRGSLGFAWMQSTDNQTGIVTETEYSQVFPNVGQVTRTQQILPNGMQLSETKASVDSHIIHDGTRGVDVYSNLNYGNVYFPYSSNVVEKHYDLDGVTWLSTTTTDTVYDLFGNSTHITIVTEDSEDTVTTDTVNTYPDADRALGRLSRATVTHTNAHGQLIRTSDFEYYPNGLLWREIVEPDNLELRLQTEYHYDSFGNKDLVTISGQDIVTRSSSTTYSPDGRFPVTVTNALGHTETRTYDPKLGVMTSLTGPNGLTTSWQYDGFGRKIREDRADGTWTTITRGMCDGYYCPEDAPLGTYLYTITESSGSTPVAEYSDQLERTLRKVTTGFDGTLVYLDTEYNHLGQASKISQPYFKGEASHWASSEYDLLGRVIKVTTQGPSGTIYNTFSYSGHTTTATNAKGHVKITKKNAQGKVLRVDEEESGWVTYKYDAIGNLLETNANGVITTLTYDDRDRKSTMDDPDMGYWTYHYDALGNLTSQTDANGQTISMVYDKLGRMVQRTELEGVTTWIYDTYDTLANGIVAHSIGKLIQIDAPDNYQQIVTYDALGRASATTTTAYGTTLTTTTTYDNFGRVSRSTRPEGFVVENAYNAQGYLEAIRTPAAMVGDYAEWQHLSQVWNEIEQPLVAELEQAQQKADELYAQAVVYRERAQYYWDTAQRLMEQAPNKQFLEDDRKATITQLRQTSANLNQLATKLEQKAAEYQLLANSILSLMPTNWQQSWFLNAKARYDQYARNAIARIEAAYQVNENTLVWTPVDVGGITIFIQVKPSFHGAGVITAQEKQHLEEIGNWEAGTAETLRAIAASARAQQAARDKYQTALANHPAMVWVPIDVDGITTMMYVPSSPLTPEQVLTADELQLYNAPDLLQTDGIALAEFYTNRAMEQVALQREVENQREYYARTASRLSQTIAAYSDAIAQLEGIESQVTFWSATGRDAAGRLTSSVVGNGLETRNFYDQATGQLTYITSGFGSSTPVRELSYEYDSLNNVTRRVDRVQGMSESFEYDRLDRLTRSNVQGQIGGVAYNRSVDYRYDALGNILHKSDVSDIDDYSYGDQNRSIGNAGPHAMVGVGSLHTGYQYDNNGNMIQGDGKEIVWSSYNKPIEFWKSGALNTSFKYGPDRTRYLKVTQSSTTTQGSTTLYLGKSYERVETGTKVEHKHFIYADGQVVAIHIKTTDNAIAQLDQTRYLHHDSLGSVDTITDGQGRIVELMSYDPFGARREFDWRAGTGALYIPTLTNRGFTGHEHIDEMDLIHMNGRVYDPQMGRFLSADPTMQTPHKSQGYNRYSYVQNNPLKYTDPSGFSFLSEMIDNIGELFSSMAKNATVRMIASIAVMFIPGLNVIAAGFLSGLVASGGDFRVAVTSAISACMFQAVGNYYKGATKFSQKAMKVIAHGVVGGISSHMSGGKFSDGFNAAAASQWFEQAGGYDAVGATKDASTPYNMVVAATVGGTVSVLGGGKFANGARTAAFSRLFNDMKHASQAAEKIKKLVELTVSSEGDASYSYASKKWLFPANEWKCNLYVHDKLIEAGFSAPEYGDGPWPIRANDWGNPNFKIPGWEIVDSPMPGDIAAIYRSSGTGHVGIYIGDRGLFSSSVMAANEFGVGWSRSHYWAEVTNSTVYRRYVGN